MWRIVLSVFVLAVLNNGVALAGHSWAESFEEAEQTAAQQHVPLLIHFYASWCGPCRLMEQRVFSSPTVMHALRDGLTAVKVNISERPDLKDRFGADTIPRDIVVYPDGSVVTLSVGLLPRTSYLLLLQDTAARGRSIAVKQMEESGLLPMRRHPRAAGLVSPDQAVELILPEQNRLESKEIIGLNGYCPVMLIGHRRWVKGEVTRAERYHGVLYYFSGDRQHVQFRRSPDRYTPRNLGCDPVVLFRQQRAVPGRVKYGVFFDGELYLFRTAESRREFKLRPLRYTRIQHAVRLPGLSGPIFE